MANNLGRIDRENNNIPQLAVNLGELKGTNVGGGFLRGLVDSGSSDGQDFYRFTLGSTAPVNSYIELSSPDVVNIEAFYRLTLYRYDAVGDQYVELETSYQLHNTPFPYRIDLTGLASGEYVFGVTGAEWTFGEATGVYSLRISIPSPDQPGTVIDGDGNANNLGGGREENTINGQGGNDVLKGGGGDDVLNGGQGNDSLNGGAHNDVLNGGSGIDQVVESGNFTEFVLTNDRLVANGVDVLISVERARLTGGAGENLMDASAFTLGGVTCAGGDDDDTLLGGSGDDALAGGAGFDLIDGGPGKDRLSGGAGGDTYVVDDLGDVVIETGIGDYDVIRSSVDYTLGTRIEELVLEGTAPAAGTGNALHNIMTGNRGDNILSGLAGDDVLNGGGGRDRLIGGLGNDSYVVDRATDVVVETATDEFELVKSSARTFTLSDNLENLTLIDYGGNGTGNRLDNTLQGNGLDNILNGSAGDDLIYGNYGNDTLLGGSGHDSLFGSIGDDRLDGGSGTDYLSGDTGNDVMNGGAGKDSFSDSLGEDTYVFRYGQSSFAAEDQVDSFTVGSDRIDLLASNGSALGRPSGLTRATDIEGFGLSRAALNQLFADADGGTVGNQPLAVNSAVIVTTYDYYNGYLLVNDGTPGFQAGSDLVINLVLYGELPAPGVLPLDSFFL